jgi:hypothetical protein
MSLHPTSYLHSTSYNILQLTLQVHHHKVWGLHPTTSYNWHYKSIVIRYEAYILQLTLQVHHNKVWGLRPTISYNWHYKSIIIRYEAYILQHPTTSYNWHYRSIIRRYEAPHSIHQATDGRTSPARSLRSLHPSFCAASCAICPALVAAVSLRGRVRTGTPDTGHDHRFRV